MTWSEASEASRRTLKRGCDVGSTDFAAIASRNMRRPQCGPRFVMSSHSFGSNTSWWHRPTNAAHRIMITRIGKRRCWRTQRENGVQTPRNFTIFLNCAFANSGAGTNLKVGGGHRSGAKRRKFVCVSYTGGHNIGRPLYFDIFASSPTFLHHALSTLALWNSAAQTHSRADLPAGDNLFPFARRRRCSTFTRPRVRRNAVIHGNVLFYAINNCR